VHGRRWPAQWEMVREQTCRAVVALSTCGSRSMRAREAVSVRGGCAADLRGSAPHCDCSHFFLASWNTVADIVVPKSRARVSPY